MMRKLTGMAVIIALILLAGPALAQAELSAAEESFAQQAAGVYTATVQGERTTLELIPAFGRLFAFTQRDNNSYVASELTLADGANAVGASQQVSVKNWSNQSRNGAYFHGEVSQRLTLTDSGLILSNVTGGGEPLVSDEVTLMRRSDTASSCFIYGPAFVKTLFDVSSVTWPASLMGTWNATWRQGGVEYISRVILEGNGIFTFLQTSSDDTPPTLVRGGWGVAELGGDGPCLCYVANALHSGAMPLAGSAMLVGDAGLELIAREDGASLFLPEDGRYIAYEPGQEPFGAYLMRTVSANEGKDYVDVTLTNPANDSEIPAKVMKYGETTFGWPSNIGSLELLSLQMKLRSGASVPVLCHLNDDVVDTLMVLRAIDDDTTSLMYQAAYYPIMRDFRREDNPSDILSAAFQDDGAPTVTLMHYLTQGNFDTYALTITARTGCSFVAEGEDMRVSFTSNGPGLITITEQEGMEHDFVGTYSAIDGN